MLRRFKTGKDESIFSGNHGSSNRSLDREGVVIPRKNIAFWLTFALFGS